jgi:hypothetical protein
MKENEGQMQDHDSNPDTSVALPLFNSKNSR